MSTISVSNIVTANGSESLTLKTGNTSGGDIIIGSTGDITIAANSIVNTYIANSTGSYFTGNVSIGSIVANGSLGSSGEVLTSNGIGIYWAAAVAATVPVSNISENALSSGTTYTVPSDLLFALVHCTGAGGGAGGADGTDTGMAAGGAGGGGGGTAIKLFTKAQLGSTCTYTIGARGSGGSNAGGNGSAGTSSTFTPGGTASGSPLTGLGGSGGAGRQTGGTSSTSDGGAGGDATGGDIDAKGQGGSIGVGASEGAGGTGGASFFGGGATGSYAGGTGSVPGNNAETPGSGGGGAACRNSTAGSIGGTGANGIIWIIEYRS